MELTLQHRIYQKMESAELLLFDHRINGEIKELEEFASF